MSVEGADPDPPLTRSSPIVHRSQSSGQLRHSAEIKSSLSKSGSEGQLKDVTNTTPRPSAPNSARSDASGIRKHKPLPPIGTTTGVEEKAEGDGDEFASITESELAEGDVHTLSSDDDTKSKGAKKKKKGGNGKPLDTTEIETQTEWSWIETMKLIQKQQQPSSHAAADEVQSADIEPDHVESVGGGRLSVGSKASRTSKAGTLFSQGSRRQSNILKEKPGEESKTFLAISPSGISAGSITGPFDDGPPEVMTTLVLPYRDDEYGVPVLQFSESDTDSDSETAAPKTFKSSKTLPSIGPPQILQYKRDLHPPADKPEQTSMGKVDEVDNSGQGDDGETLMSIDTVNELITFTGNCEFCNNPIKPFPTLHQQQIMSPQELYCCEEFANFVRLAILPPPPNAHLIDIKPHAHFGSKQARAAAREKAQARIREREVQKAQQVHSAHTGSGAGAASGTAGAGGAGASGGGGGGGGGQQQSQTSGGGGGQVGGGGPMFAYARAMKTINFQLSSQKCIDEGYVVRPPSPLVDQEQLDNPFEIEPLEWFAAGDEDQDYADGDADDEFEYDDSYIVKDKPPPRRRCVERYYPDETKFLTMFPDGTGNVFYANGQLAISVSSIHPGQFTYLVYDVQSEEGQPQQLLAEFDPDAVATCYHRTGNIRLFLDQLGGMEAHPDGSRRKRWHWLDQSTHQHAPPVQPLCFAVNKFIGIRVLNQNNIFMTFLNYQRSCRFNVGVKLKLVHPENLPTSELWDEDQIYMNEKANRVSGLLDKIENLLKYPHSSRADKIKLPKRVTIKAEKIEKHKNQANLAREQEKQRKSKKLSRPLAPLEQSEFDPVLMTETGELLTPHSTVRAGGRPPKHPVVVVN